VVLNPYFLPLLLLYLTPAPPHTLIHIITHTWTRSDVLFSLVTSATTLTDFNQRMGHPPSYWGPQTAQPTPVSNPPTSKSPPDTLDWIVTDLSSTDPKPFNCLIPLVEQFGPCSERFWPLTPLTPAPTLHSAPPGSPNGYSYLPQPSGG